MTSETSLSLSIESALTTSIPAALFIDVQQQLNECYTHYDVRTIPSTTKMRYTRHAPYQSSSLPMSLPSSTTSDRIHGPVAITSRKRRRSLKTSHDHHDASPAEQELYQYLKQSYDQMLSTDVGLQTLLHRHGDTKSVDNTPSTSTVSSPSSIMMQSSITSNYGETKRTNTASTASFTALASNGTPSLKL
jgi:hypothetical protein